jgi:hypothetical protein
MILASEDGISVDGVRGYSSWHPYQRELGVVEF